MNRSKKCATERFHGFQRQAGFEDSLSGSLLHFIGKGGWLDEPVLAKVRELVLPNILRHGPIQAWIIDDTGFPKQGKHSVGVARQYCGQLGKQDNCQVAVSLSLANHHASLPVAYRLYLPKDWAADDERRHEVGVPKEIVFKTKPEIALDQLRWACKAGLPRGVVLVDAGFGNNSKLRTQITALDLTYGRNSVEHHGMGSRHRAAAAEAMVGPRSAADAYAPRRQAPADLSQEACTRPAKARLAHDQMARRHGRAIVLALCARACSRCAPR